MTQVPPEMEFDREDGRGFEEYDEEPRPRREPRRPETAWEKQAATWRGPEFHAACCGTVYGAMTQGDLALMLRLHQDHNPFAVHSHQRAPIELGRNV
jgi:hypothetical protein